MDNVNNNPHNEGANEDEMIPLFVVFENAPAIEVPPHMPDEVSDLIKDLGDNGHPFAYEEHPNVWIVRSNDQAWEFPKELE